MPSLLGSLFAETVSIAAASERERTPCSMVLTLPDALPPAIEEGKEYMFIGTCWREATPAVAVALVKSRRRRRLSLLCSRWLPLHLSRQTRSAGTRLPAKVDTCIQVYEYMYESVAGERERGPRCTAAL